MSMFGLDWWCDDTKEVGDLGGVIVEFGGTSVKLTEPEIIAALKAAEAVRNGDAIAIDADGEVTILCGKTTTPGPVEDTQTLRKDEYLAKNPLVPGICHFIGSDGQVIEVNGRHEEELKAAIMCLEESQGSSTPFFELVSHLLFCASCSHLTKEDVDSALQEFDLNWNALNEAVTHLAKYSPATLTEALASQGGV